MKMKLADAGTYIGAHMIAGAAYCLLFILLPLLLMVVGIVVLIILAIIFNDPGGPLWLPVSLGLCAIYFLITAAGGLCLFVLTSLIQLLRCKITIPWWIPLIAIMILSSTILWAFSMSKPLLWAFLISLPFFVYWTSLVSAETIAKWIRSKIDQRKIRGTTKKFCVR
jgi:hypothetical protein